MKSACLKFLLAVLVLERLLSFAPVLGFVIREFATRGRMKKIQLRIGAVGSSHLPLDCLISENILDVAVNASLKAGEIIRGYASGAKVLSSKANTRDLLTSIDPLCEKIIKETVMQHFPDHDFLGEEDVAPGKKASSAAIREKLCAGNKTDFLWIVDPIDGTTNFVHGMPLCVPSIAVSYRGNIIIGVIYDPHRDELFTTIKGGGAFMNGQPIHVRQEKSLEDAVVAMGSPPGQESLQKSLMGVHALMPKVRTLRMLGSAALMLAWVANGRLTCYWEYDLSSWDICAGALLVDEAGGQFSDLQGKSFDPTCRKICASNGKVHADILRILCGAGIA